MVIVPFCSSNSPLTLNTVFKAACLAFAFNIGLLVFVPRPEGSALITFPYLSTTISTTTFPSSFVSLDNTGGVTTLLPVKLKPYPPLPGPLPFPFQGPSPPPSPPPVPPVPFVLGFPSGRPSFPS